MDVRSLGTILGVWAHPDDEAYLSAGVMAMATRAGSRVVCVTATRGELGSADLDQWPLETLADVRTVEMAASLDILGVREHHWLDYPDGACAAHPRSDAVGRLVELISSVQPDTVVTFGPDGMTGHLDHQTVSDWTTKAFRQAAEPGRPPVLRNEDRGVRRPFHVGARAPAWRSARARPARLRPRPISRSVSAT